MKNAVSLSDVPLSTKNKIYKKIDHILKNRDIILHSVRSIIEDLVFLKENQDLFLAMRNMTVEEWVQHELNISKATFYQHIKAYKLCQEYGNPEVYEQVPNYKVLLELSKVPDEKVKEKTFKKIVKDPDKYSVYDIEELRGSPQGYYEKSQRRRDFYSGDDGSNGKSSIASHYMTHSSNEKSSFKKIEIGILEHLVSVYEHVAKAFEEDTSSGESSEAIVRTYNSVIRDLKDIIEFADIK